MDNFDEKLVPLNISSDETIKIKKIFIRPKQKGIKFAKSVPLNILVRMKQLK